MPREARAAMTMHFIFLKIRYDFGIAIDVYKSKLRILMKHTYNVIIKKSNKSITFKDATSNIFFDFNTVLNVIFFLKPILSSRKI